MTPDQGALAFGTASSLLYLWWAFFMYGTPEKHMAITLTFYACANVPIMWPSINRVFL